MHAHRLPPAAEPGRGMSGRSLLLSAAGVQIVLARLGCSTWWIPDLLLVALILSVAASPSRWLLYGIVAGGISALWAVRVPWALWAANLLLAGLIRVGARHWDLSDARVQQVLVGVANLLMRLWLVWLDDTWSLALVGPLLLQTGVTVLVVPLLNSWRHHPVSG